MSSRASRACAIARASAAARASLAFMLGWLRERWAVITGGAMVGILLPLWSFGIPASPASPPLLPWWG